MFYALIGDESLRIIKLKSTSLEDAQKEVASKMNEPPFTTQRALKEKYLGDKSPDKVKILHVIGECNFDVDKWNKENPPATLPTARKVKYSREEYHAMYQETGGEG